MSSNNDLPEMHPQLKGFCRIEETSCYINVFGRVWSEEKQKFLTPYVCDYSSSGLYGSYPTIRLDDDAKHPRALHILVAESFVEKPMDKDAKYVNHIDGDKLNYFAANLEWTTASENLIHAFKTGLRTDNKPVLLKDLTTGRITRFYSMNECSRQLGINTSTLHLYMKREQTLPLMRRYDVIHEGKTWNPIPKCNIGLERLGKDRTIIGVEKSTKSTYLFASVAKASEHTGVSKHIVWNRVMRNDKPRTRYCGVRPTELDWEFFYLKDFKGSLDNIKEVLGQARAGKGLVRAKKPPVPIEVKNLISGEIKQYPSSEAFCMEHGVKKRTVQHAVYLRGRWKEYEIRYLRAQ